MPYELIATLMFSTMMLMLLTGKRVLVPSVLLPLFLPLVCGGMAVLKWRSVPR